MATRGRSRPQPLDPEVRAALRSLGLTRRSFLRSIGVGGAALAGGGLLTACGVDAPAAPGGGGVEEPTASEPVEDRTVGGELNFSNWPLYIDVSEEDENVRPTLEQFTEKTGVKVNYFEDINSNDEYFGKIRNQLAAGEDIGRDLIVLTDWMAGRLISLGWVAEIDLAAVPNWENMLPALKDVQFDPGRRYSLTWQSGMTGIGYDPDAVGRELSSIKDLFAEDLAGKVTLLSEMRDTMALVMLSEGIDPVDHEFSEYEAAIETLRGYVDSGQIRAFTGNEYANDLAAGNIAAAAAYSGDVIQLQFDNPRLRFLVPDEGAVLWSDNMLIPANAANPGNAQALMNFVYTPQVAAQIAAWVNYITPVEGAQEAMEAIDPELAENELIFPSPETLSNTYDFKLLDADEEAEYQSLFQSVIGA